MKARTSTRILPDNTNRKRFARSLKGVTAAQRMGKKRAAKARFLQELEGAIAEVKAHIRGEIKLPDISQLFDEFKEL